MYLNSLEIDRFRAFEHAAVRFHYPGAANSGSLKFPNVPDWLTEADNGEEPAWGRVKAVFTEVQYFKCGYCERPMPRPQRRNYGDDTERRGGTREYDLEHFRPKNAVSRWPTKASGRHYDFETGDAMAGGYPWLAHDCLNYLASCKTFNSDNKRFCFPIAGHRGNRCDNVGQLNRSERPFLVNPVGTSDVKPEELIGIYGFLATPRGSRGHKRRRGTIIMDLFGLNLRDDLTFQRCILIRAMWPYLENRRIGNERQRKDAVSELGNLTHPSSPHVNCARCFEILHASDRNAARNFYEAALAQSEKVQGLRR